MENFVRVWVWVFIIQDKRVLIWKRKNSYWEWKYGFPWWHLEFWESIQECAIRELYEETSLIWDMESISLIHFTDDFMKEYNKHYITVFSIVRWFTGDVSITEPDKIQKWEWLTWEEIKKLWNKNFLPIQNFIKKYPDFDPTK